MTARFGVRCVAMVMVVTGCGSTTSTTPPVVPVASVSLSSTAVDLVVGATIQLNATPKDAAGNALSGRTVTWASSATGVATVSSTGLVTAVTAGTATVTATSEGKTADAIITVKPGAVVGAAGGTVTSADGNAAVVIPAGALSQPTGITVEPAATFPASRLLVAGTPYDFGPSGTQFAQPVTVRIKYDRAKVPAGTPQGAIQLNIAGAAAWTPLAGSTVDTVAHVVQGPTTHFTGFGGVNSPIILTESNPDIPEPGFGDIITDLTVCVGGGEPLSVVALDPLVTLNVDDITVTSDNPAIADVEKTPDILGRGGPPQISIGGDAPGTTKITVVAKGVTIRLNVTVINTVPPCKHVTMAATEAVTGGDAIYLIHDAVQSAANSDQTGFLIALGLERFAGKGPPLAYRSGLNQNSWVLKTLFDGPNTAEVQVPVTPNAFPFATAWYDVDTFLYLQNSTVAPFTSDIYATTRGSGLPIRLTNLGGVMSAIAAGPPGTILVDWRPPGIGTGTSHLFSLPFLGTSGPPATAGLVPMTSGSGEFQGAVSQNDAWMAYTQFDPFFTHSQILVQDLTKPAHPPVPITPATGFAFTPSWCGNKFIYFISAPTLNGPFQLMRRDVALDRSVAVTAAAGATVAELSVARTTGAQSALVCPR